MNRLENLCTKLLMIDCLSICPSICPCPWGSVPVKAERCSHTAWAQQAHAELSHRLHLHKCSTQKHRHRYTSQAESIGCQCLRLPARLSVISVIVSETSFLFCSPSISIPGFSSASYSVLTISLGGEYMQLLPKPERAVGRCTSANWVSQ